MTPAQSMARFAPVPKMYMLLLASWLFDFQSAGDGQGLEIQGYFIGTYLFALIMLLIGERSTGRTIRGQGLLVVCGALFLGVGIISGLSNGQEVYAMLRNAASVFIYVSTAFVTARVVLESNPTQLRQVLSMACLLYSVSAYFVYDFMAGGVDLQEVRFQIIGASVMGALGYIVLAVLFKLSRIEQAAILANGVILVLSVTRSFILVALAQASPFVGRIRQIFSPRLILLAIVGAFALLAFLYVGQSQLLRWEGRLFGSGSTFTEYETFYTRLSEWTYMISEWTLSVWRFLFGSGLAARTVYDEASALTGGTGFMIGFGHNLHLSLLFIAGAVGGFPLLFLQWHQVFLSWRFLRRTIAFPDLRNDAVFLGAWGATILLGYFAVNFVSAPFVSRGPSFWFGIGTGLLLGAQARFDPANALRPKQASLPARGRLRPA